jgi:hypothetical protein
VRGSTSSSLLTPIVWGLTLNCTANVQPGNWPVEVIWQIRITSRYAPSFQVQLRGNTVRRHEVVSLSVSVGYGRVPSAAKCNATERREICIGRCPRYRPGQFEILGGAPKLSSPPAIVSDTAIISELAVLGIGLWSSSVPSYLFARSGSTEPAPRVPSPHRGRKMKPRTLTCLTAMTLFTALAFP